MDNEDRNFLNGWKRSLENRITAIETKMKERWQNHNEAALEFRDFSKNIYVSLEKQIDSLKDMLNKMNISFTKEIGSLSCKEHAEKLKGIDYRVRLLTTLVITVLIGGVVLGIWVRSAGS